MTPDEIRAEVERIRSMTGDYEAAHSTEDDLYIQVLRAIAAGECADPAACAREALRTQDFAFQRWCA